MAGSAAVAATVGPNHGLFSTPVVEVAEAATQTFKAGAVIAINASGYAIEASSPNPTNILGVASFKGLNLATAGTGVYATGGVGQTMLVPALPHVVFEMNLDDSTALGYVLAQTDLYASYGLIKDATTGIWYVDHSATGASARVIVVGFKGAVGDAAARVYVVFRETQTIYT